MPRHVSPEEYRSTIQGYVGEAHSLADAIINRVLAEEDTDAVKLRARTASVGPLIVDRERITALWAGRRPLTLHSLEADIPLDNGNRLGLNDNHLIGRMLRAWVYSPTSEDEAALVDGANVQLAAERAVPWRTRDALSRLVLPGYLFTESGFSSDDDFSRTFVSTYMYTQREEQSGETFFHGAFGIGNVSLENYRRTIAPPITLEEMALIESEGTSAYDRLKITELLQIMNGVAHPIADPEQ